MSPRVHLARWPDRPPAGPPLTRLVSLESVREKCDTIPKSGKRVDSETFRLRKSLVFYRSGPLKSVGWEIRVPRMPRFEVLNRLFSLCDAGGMSFPMPKLERRRIYFSGRVQGVGFRYTTERLAKDYEITGYVRNLPDGRVELIVEGEWSVISDFLSAIVMELEPHIHDVSSETETLDEQSMSDFRILY